MIPNGVRATHEGRKRREAEQAIDDYRRSVGNPAIIPSVANLAVDLSIRVLELPDIPEDVKEMARRLIRGEDGPREDVRWVGTPRCVVCGSPIEGAKVDLGWTCAACIALRKQPPALQQPSVEVEDRPDGGTDGGNGGRYD